MRKSTRNSRVLMLERDRPTLLSKPEELTQLVSELTVSET